MHAELARDFPPVVEDRALEAELRLCLSRGDPTAIAAVWARLCRVAEKALAG